MDEKPKTLFPKLDALGFQVEFQSHAEAILSVDFPDAVSELQDVLAVATIPIEEIIAGGGGEAKGTQRLRRALSAVGWAKTCFEVNKVIKTGPLPDQTRESESVTHEIDHVKSMAKGSIALEIEWNNKDPFFDRDLENFKRLHVDGAISVGIIVTRGTTLQDNMPSLVTRFLDERKVQSFENLATWGYERHPNSARRSQSELHARRTPFSGARPSSINLCRTNLAQPQHTGPSSKRACAGASATHVRSY